MLSFKKPRICCQEIGFLAQILFCLAFEVTLGKSFCLCFLENGLIYVATHPQADVSYHLLRDYYILPDALDDTNVRYSSHFQRV